MYDIEINKKIFKFIESLNNSKTVWEKIKKLKKFKQNQSINLDIKKLNSYKSSKEMYRF